MRCWPGAAVTTLRCADTPWSGMRGSRAERFHAPPGEGAAGELKILTTEREAPDTRLPAAIAARDAAVAAVTADYLAVACAHPAMDGVLSWGLADAKSWLNESPDY